MIPLQANANVDNSDTINYPDGRIKNNDGTGNGTPVDRNVYGDTHSNISRLMRLYDIIPNGLPDNETNGYQIVDAISALASKNDYIYPLTTNGTTELIITGVKLSLLKENEFLVCLAASDKTTETYIKGSNNTSLSVVYSGNFKANEYVRVIRTSTGVSIVRIADWNSLNAMVSDLFFLKKASQTQENAGTSDTVATTPLVNKTVFERRVNGADSTSYLASSSQNGLMSKAQFDQLASLANNVKNAGWFSGLDISVGGVINYPVSGNITAAQSFVLPGQANEQFILVTMQNAMSNTNYYVRSFTESQGDIRSDNDINGIVFKPISNTQFQISMKESTSGNQSLKIHLEVVQL